jgi:hypothetical protein
MAISFVHRSDNPFSILLSTYSQNQAALAKKQATQLVQIAIGRRSLSDTVLILLIAYVSITVRNLSGDAGTGIAICQPLRRLAMNSSKCDELSNSQVPTEEIARRAYELWEARGCPAGDGTQDWDAAVAELTSRDNGSSGGLRHWWDRLRRSIVDRG